MAQSYKNPFFCLSGRVILATAVFVFFNVIAGKILFAVPAHDISPNVTIPGTLVLSSTFQAISVKAPFAQDANGDNSAVIQFRQTGTTDWLTAGPFFIDRRATLAGVSNPYSGQARGSIVGLAANTSYDVQIVWSDPDGVAPQAPIATISTLSYSPPTGGIITTVTDDSTLSAALATVNPGDTISAEGFAMPYHRTTPITVRRMWTSSGMS